MWNTFPLVQVGVGGGVVGGAVTASKSTIVKGFVKFKFITHKLCALHSSVLINVLIVISPP